MYWIYGDASAYPEVEPERLPGIEGAEVAVVDTFADREEALTLARSEGIRVWDDVEATLVVEPGETFAVEFYDERGNRLETRQLRRTPRMGEAFDIVVVREGVLRLVVTMLTAPHRVIVEPPDMSN